MRFAVHGPGIPVASPRSHRMPCGDVPGRIHVSIADKAAGSASEDGLALARLPVNVPTCAAALARERGVNLLNATGGLVVQSAGKPTPSGHEDFPVQPGLLAHAMSRLTSGTSSATGHILNRKPFQPNHIEPACQTSADLLAPVLPSVNLANPEPGNGESDLGPTITPRFCAGQPALQQSQSPLAALTRLRTSQQFSSRQRSADCHASINADDLSSARPGDRGRDNCERNVPSARPVQSDTKRLHAIRYGTRPAESNPATFRNEYSPGLSVQATHMLGPDCHNTETLVTLSLAPCRSTMGPPEKVSHCLVEIAERLLLNHLAAGCQPCVFVPDGRELPALLQISWRARSAGTPPRLLLAGEIPHEPCVPAMLAQHCFLGSRRKQAIAGHTKTLKSATDIPERIAL